MQYSDLVNFWNEGRKKWTDYEFEVGNVAACICDFFRKKLELKTDESKRYLLLIPLKEKNSETIKTTWYAPHACVEFETAGWANVGMLLILQMSENAWPKQQFVFKISIKKQNGVWLIRLAEDGELHKLNEIIEENELEPLFDEFIRLVKFQTIDYLKHWLEG